MLNKEEYNELVGLLEAIMKVDCYSTEDIFRSQLLLRNASDEQIEQARTDASVEPEECI